MISMIPSHFADKAAGMIQKVVKAFAKLFTYVRAVDSGLKIPDGISNLFECRVKLGRISCIMYEILGIFDTILYYPQSV